MCLSVWMFSHTVLILALFASLFGFTSGAVISLLPSAASQIVPEHKVGARVGAFYGLISIATLAGAPIGIAIIGKDPMTKEDYRGLIAFSVGPLRSTS